MQQCQICGRQCQDNVKFCPSCGNNNFAQITENQQPEQNADAAAQNGYQNQPEYSYSYGQNQANDQDPFAQETKMTKNQFYKRCIPSNLKGEMNTAYGILILNLVVFLGLMFWYEEPERLLDCAVLAVILLGLILTKSLVFAIIDAAYFTFAFILSFVQNQRGTGLLAIIVAFSLVPATYKIGKLWKQYKSTGEYVDYTAGTTNAAKKKSKTAIVISVAAFLIMIVAVCAGLIFLRDGGFSSFERGSWEGTRYENESLNLAIDLPSSSWRIFEEEELEELNEEAKSQAGFAKTEEFDCMVQNLAAGSNIMILHLKGSFSEKEAIEEIKTNLTESYRKQYGVPIITEAGKKKLGGETYTCLEVRVSIYGVSMYQRVYVGKVGRELCEIGFTGPDKETIDEMEQFCSELD